MKNIDENKILYLYVEKFYTQRKLAKLFNCSQWKIGIILKKHNIKGNNKKTFRDQNEINNIIKLYNLGKTTSKIAKKYKCSAEYIRKILKNNGIETSLRVKIDKKTLKTLIFKKHYSLKQLCDFFNCSSNTIERNMKKYDIKRLPPKYEKDQLVGKKHCNSCGEEKNIDNFNTRKLLSGTISIVSDCKDCISEKNKIIREKTKVKNKKNSKKNNRNINKKKLCCRCSNIKDIINFSKCSVNPDGLQYICKKCQSDEFRKYSVENKSKMFEIRNRRRERELSVVNNYSDQHFNITMKIFNNKCFNCGAEEKLSLDHHYPLSKGYAMTIDNAILLCRSCNSAKKDILPEYFYSKKQLLKLNKILKKAKTLAG